ncbi:MAG: hypothetical protein K0R12_1295 [Gammaproteobacteria bacterium]|jgi:hypothetical protein|nr:hypothetical protein [Gammaproteobacteria bacterium]
MRGAVLSANRVVEEELWPLIRTTPAVAYNEENTAANIKFFDSSSSSETPQAERVNNNADCEAPAASRV